MTTMGSARATHQARRPNPAPTLRDGARRDGSPGGPGQRRARERLHDQWHHPGPAIRVKVGDRLSCISRTTCGSRPAFMARHRAHQCSDGTGIAQTRSRWAGPSSTILLCRGRGLLLSLAHRAEKPSSRATTALSSSRTASSRSSSSARRPPLDETKVFVLGDTTWRAAGIE